MALVGRQAKHLVDKGRVGPNELKDVGAQVSPDVCPLIDDILSLSLPSCLLSQLGLHILQEGGATLI